MYETDVSMLRYGGGMSQKDDLLEGAKKCIAEKGFARTTARDIATVSGANLASIGYYYGSKDKLLTAAVLETWDEWGRTLEEAMTRSVGDSPLERLNVILESLEDGLRGRRDILVASFQAMVEAEFSPEIRQRIEAQYQEGRRTLAAAVLNIDEQDVDDDDLALGSLVLGLVNGYSVERYAVPGHGAGLTNIAGALQRLVGPGSARP